MSGTEPAIIVELWPLPCAVLAALVTPRYLWAAFWASLFYIFGKIFFDFEGINPNGLANGYPFEGAWFASLLGQLLAVWTWTAVFYWMLRKVHASRAKQP